MGRGVAGGKGVCGWWRGRYLGGGEGRRRVWLVGRGWQLCRSKQLWWVAEMVECNI